MNELFLNRKHEKKHKICGVSITRHERYKRGK